MTSHGAGGQQDGELTSGEDHIPGNQFVVNYGKLRELDPRHARHSSVSALPVELYVVCCVTIWGHRKRIKVLSLSVRLLKLHL